MLGFAEAPGDGPSRAALGFRWFLTQRPSFFGHWPPGHEVLIGHMLHLVPDPIWAGRVLSLLAGTLAIPLLHALTRRLFGPAAALAAAAALALNPMHAALSATSLSETIALAALLALLIAAFRLGDEPRDGGALAVMALAALLGASVRFEFWLALPVVALHHLARTRSIGRAALVTLLLLPYPALWLAERAAISRGGLFTSYGGTISGLDTVDAFAVDLAAGAAILGSSLTALLGAPLLLLALLGAAALLILDRPVPQPLDRAALLLLTALQGLLLVKLAADLGEAFWPRYTLLMAVLLLALAASLLRLQLPRGVKAAGLVAAILAMPLTSWSRGLDLHLVREIPAPTRAAAAWVAERAPNEAFLLTRLAWQSSYIPVLARLHPQRYRIISFWLPDEELRRFVRAHRPTYILTRKADQEHLDRLCRLTGLGADSARQLASFGRIVVLPLAPQSCVPAG